MAYYFHLSPKQVDEMELVTVEALMIQLPLWINKTKRESE